MCCEAVTVLKDRGELRYVKCSLDGDPFCYYHQKVDEGQIQPNRSNRDEHPKMERVEAGGRVLWEA
jgi:hypothetical protein